MKRSDGRRFLAGRDRRSPRMSSSPMTSRPSSTKPCSSGQTATPSAPGGRPCTVAIVGNGHRRRGAMLLQQMLQAARRALGVARDQHAPAGGVGRLHMLGHRVEQVDALRRARPGEAFVAAAGEIDRVRRVGRGIEAGELADGVAFEQASHSDGFR